MDVNTPCMTYSESGQPTGGGPCSGMVALDKGNVVMRRQMERLIDERDAAVARAERAEAFIKAISEESLCPIDKELAGEFLSSSAILATPSFGALRNNDAVDTIRIVRAALADTTANEVQPSKGGESATIEPTEDYPWVEIINPPKLWTPE